MKKLNVTLTIFGIIYIILSIPVFIFLKETLYLMLGWNMVLALIPFLISIWLYNHHSRIKKWFLICTLILWVLFYPNTIYFITDLIHLSKVHFYESNYLGTTYSRDINSLISFSHITIGSIGGLLLGLVSLFYMENTLKTYIAKTNYFVMIVSLLSGVAIYIGRFLRFNSWDVLNPIKLITSFIASLDGYAILFILFFSFFIYFSYFFFRRLISINELK